MKVIRSHLPKSSILNSSHNEYHYVDSFQGVINDPENKFTSEDVGKVFFQEAQYGLKNYRLWPMKSKLCSYLNSDQDEFVFFGLRSAKDFFLIFNLSF